MNSASTRCRRLVLAGLLLAAGAAPAAEVELIAVLTPPPAHADAMSYAAAVLRGVDGAIYLLDRSDGRLLRIRDNAVDAAALTGKDKPFRSRKLGGFAQIGKDQFAVANTSDDLLAVVAADGKAQIVFSGGGSAHGELKDPGGVAFSTRQRLYVADRSNARVSVYTPDGLFLIAIGEQDPATDKLERPVQVGVDGSERVYVLEEKGRLSFYKHNGALIRRLNAESLKDASDRRPAWSALAVSVEGDVFIADKANGKILWIDGASGKLLRRFGSRGSGRGQFEEVTALAAAPNRELIVADSGNKKIEIYRTPAPEKEVPATALSLANVRRGPSRALECEAAYFQAADLLCLKRSPSTVARLTPDGKQTGKLGGNFSSPRIVTSTDKG
ncbi:MAG TPA: NHL repeat-containing protein, partial [Burkholderiales bacterium]|nr:NHL repeat-containing protein [Burkholderiales bacterium]